MKTIWKLTIAQLRMYGRDRQSIFFSFFFTLFFMVALGYMVGGGEVEPVEIGLVVPPAAMQNPLADALRKHEFLNVHEEGEAEAREALRKGDRAAVVLVPAAEDTPSTTGSTQVPLSVLVDRSDIQRTEQTLALLRSVLIDVEHEVRGTEPLYALNVEDVEARELRYIDFLIPGLLAFMVMQLSVAGSGFNIVEYKRKGILRRLFATPLRPFEFIVSLITSRLVIVLLQITFLLLIAKFLFDISIEGSIGLLYLFVILGSILFLGLGFALGGVAKTQNAVMTLGNLLIFPQVFLAGVFFAHESLPAWIQPFAYVLPLNFVSDALRQVANEGATLMMLVPDIIGIGVWTIVGIFLATWLFKWGEPGDA